MRVWSTLRPIFIGTYPKEYGVREIVNFGGRKMVPEIGRLAYGYIDYEQDLPKEEQEHYDLRPAKVVNKELEQLARKMASAMRRCDMKEIGRIVDKAYETSLINDESELIEQASLYL